MANTFLEQQPGCSSEERGEEDKDKEKEGSDTQCSYCTLKHTFVVGANKQSMHKGVKLACLVM